MTTTEKQPVHFDEESHTYTVGDRVVPSVTQVLKSAGLIDDRWFNDEARNRGTYVAIATELADSGQLGTVPESIKGYVDAWRRFMDSDAKYIIHNEKPFVHPHYGYAGTPDKILRWNGTPFVIDIKAGVAMPHYPLQTAGYAGLEIPGVDALCKRACVYLGKDGSFKTRAHTDHRDWDTFLAALKIVHWKKEHLK